MPLWTSHIINGVRSAVVQKSQCHDRCRMYQACRAVATFVEKSMAAAYIAIAKMAYRMGRFRKIKLIGREKKLPAVMPAIASRTSRTGRLGANGNMTETQIRI